MPDPVPVLRMQTLAPRAHSAWNPRRLLIGLVAVSVSLPIAWISLAKVLLFIGGLLYVLASARTPRPDPALQTLWTPRVILLALVCFAISLAWTGADLPSALNTFVKHSKLLDVALLIALIRTLQEARVAIAIFGGGQIFLLLSSWLMYAGVPIPWSMDAPTKYVVFSSYLDQSIMLASSAGVLWHLRAQKLWPSWLGAAAAALALANALFLLEGRSGYVVAVTSLSLALMWAMPRRLRLATLVLTPLILLLGLALGSVQVQERVTKIFSEGRDFAKTQQVGAENSTGWRLNAWHRAVQAIDEKPILGQGVGGWTPAAKRFEGPENADFLFGPGNHSNPHQEYLLWGVELGLGGIALLLALVVAMARDALGFPTAVQRAALSMLAAMALACLFNSALHDDLMGDFFCVSLGLLMALGARANQEADPTAATPERAEFPL